LYPTLSKVSCLGHQCSIKWASSVAYEEAERAGFLGGEAFMERVFDHVDLDSLSPGIVRKDRPALSLAKIFQKHTSRDAAIQEAYNTGTYTITEIAAFFGIHRSTVSRLIRR